MSRVGEQRRIALGLCANCGKGPLATTRRCQACRDNRRIYDNTRNRTRIKGEDKKAQDRLAQKRRYDRHRAAGICVRCARERALPERTVCPDCRVLQVEIQKARRMGKPYCKLPARPMLKVLPKPGHTLDRFALHTSRLGWCIPRGSLALQMVRNGK